MAETIFIKYYEDTDCLHGYSVERTVELTRQEAIERMAKAIREIACEGYLHKDTDPLTSTASAIDYAKAALNAIVPMIPKEAQNER